MEVGDLVMYMEPTLNRFGKTYIYLGKTPSELWDDTEYEVVLGERGVEPFGTHIKFVVVGRIMEALG